MNNTENNQYKSSHYSAKKLAGMAIFTALAYVISLLEFPIFPVVPFLKLDFSNVFIMMAGFMYGPIPGILVGIMKELLRLIGSSTLGVGEIANFSIIIAYILPPALVYTKFKSKKVVCILLLVSCVLHTVVALVVNKFITFPLYGWGDKFNSVVWYVAGFNLIKSVSNSVITILLYKRIGYIFEYYYIR